MKLCSLWRCVARFSSEFLHSFAQTNDLDKVLLHEPGDNASVSVKMRYGTCTQVDDYGSMASIHMRVAQLTAQPVPKIDTPFGLLNWFKDSSKKIVAKHIVDSNGYKHFEFMVPSLIRECFVVVLCMIDAQRTNNFLVVIAATKFVKVGKGKPKEVKILPNFQKFTWQTDYEGGAIVKKAMTKYYDDWEEATDFFQSATTAIPDLGRHIFCNDKVDKEALIHQLELQDIVACNGYLYYGCATPLDIGKKINITPLNLLFGKRRAKFAFGVTKMATGVTYSTGMRVSLSRHRQEARDVPTQDGEKQVDVTWRILGILFSTTDGRKQDRNEPVLICYNSKISRYDYQYKKEGEGEDALLVADLALPDVPICDYPRWNFSPVSKVKFTCYHKARKLSLDEEIIRNIALQGTVKDPEDDRSESEDNKSTDGNDNTEEKVAPSCSQIPKPKSTSHRQQAPKSRPKASQAKHLTSVQAELEKLKERNTSLQKELDKIKADNDALAKLVEDSKTGSKKLEQAERLKETLLDHYITKFEDRKDKDNPRTFIEFFPKVLAKYFTPEQLDI